ncbi:MFS transporter [Mesomycoplasma hyopneumoniae]|uniref:MFS transporter n=1 Tax=Mesomycoplasma hyopneumoniae TaxID=2099 RepID=UPI0032AFFF34
MTNFIKNACKYTSSLNFSLVGSEAFKFSSSLYIYKITGDFWLVTILYLLIQLPSLIVYLFSTKIVKRWENDKLILLISDLFSALVLGILLIIFFFGLDIKTYQFSIILIFFNTLLGFIHSFRFIYLKNIVYFLAQNQKQMVNINILSTFATSMGFLLSAIFGLFLYTKLEFYWMIIFNLFTYLVSGFLYCSLKLNSQKMEFSMLDEKPKKVIHNYPKINFYKWLFIFSGSLVISIIMIPKLSGFAQFFKYINSGINLDQKNLIYYDFQIWGPYLNIAFSFAAVIGTLINFWLSNKKGKIFNINFLIFPLILVHLIWLIIPKSANMHFQFYSYIIIIIFVQVLFSLFLPSFYSLSYNLFTKEKFHFQNGIQLAARIIFSSIFSIITTAITLVSSYFFSYLVFVIVLSVLLLINSYSLFRIAGGFKKY